MLFTFRWNLFCDYPVEWGIGFQDPASNWMYAIIDLHDRIIFFELILLILVLWFLVSALTNKDHLPYLSHGNVIELVWTITPALILWMIGLPSLHLLYLIDELFDAEVTVLSVGNQWFIFDPDYITIMSLIYGFNVRSFSSKITAPHSTEGDGGIMTILYRCFASIK